MNMHSSSLLLIALLALCSPICATGAPKRLSVANLHAFESFQPLKKYSTPPPEPLHDNCADLISYGTSQNLSYIWSFWGGDKSLNEFLMTFTSDQKFAPNGATLAEESGNDFDRAAMCYFGDTRCLSGPNCGIGQSTCGQLTNLCNGAQDADKPGPFLVLSSMTQLNNFLNTMYFAVQDAGESVHMNINSFVGDFDPPTTPNVPLEYLLESVQIVLGLMTGGVSADGAEAEAVVAHVGPVNARAKSEASSTDETAGKSGLSGGVVNTIGGGILNIATTVVENSGTTAPDLGSVLDAIVSCISASYDNWASALFRTGMAGGTTLAGLMANGGLIADNPQNFTGDLEPMIEKVLYMKLADYIWTQDDGNIPFIAVDHFPCGQGTSIITEQLGSKTSQASVTIGQSCYYLLSATNEACDGGNSHVHHMAQCCSMSLLAGGNTGVLDGAKYAGLLPNDFIQASVNSWEANCKENGWGSPKLSETTPSSPYSAGVPTSIPICDYNTKSFPGWNCPLIPGYNNPNDKARACQINLTLVKGGCGNIQVSGSSIARPTSTMSKHEGPPHLRPNHPLHHGPGPVLSSKNSSTTHHTGSSIHHGGPGHMESVHSSSSVHRPSIHGPGPVHSSSSTHQPSIHAPSPIHTSSKTHPMPSHAPGARPEENPHSLPHGPGLGHGRGKDEL